MIVTGESYEMWQDEVICTVPKVPGSAALDDTRPIRLVPILRNVFMGIQTMLMQDTWDETRLLSTLQHGFVRKMGTQGLRLIQNTIYEFAYLFRAFLIIHQFWAR